jgi:hypothetical protein
MLGVMGEAGGGGWGSGRRERRAGRVQGLISGKLRLASAGIDTKDCPLARDNQIRLSGKQIPMQTCPPDNQIVYFLLIFNTLYT